MSNQTDKERLIKQMRSQENEKARAAVDELRERGWLTDGTLHKADLRGAHLRGAHLSRADLSWAVLSGADLRGADLVEASLSGADLSRANLSRADLSRANLSGADLFGTSLSGADLSEASLLEASLLETNLSEASLLGTNLSGANLSEAIFTAAVCYGTVFAGIDLSEVIGLEVIQHRGPSTVGVDTLYKSRGQIPEVFLRGCGLEEGFIQYMLPLVKGSAIEFYSCFISYSHADASFARRVHDTLQGRGIRCWLDEHQMLPGDDIYEEIDRGIRYWDKVLLCCSEASLASWWVDNEINKIFKKERQLMREREEKILALIPLDLDGYLFSDDFTSGKKDEIQSRIAADFKGWEHDNAIFEREIERVIRALRTDDFRKEPPPIPKL